MAVFNSTLGVYNHTPFPSPCPPHTAAVCHLGTFGPAVTFVSATISSGAPPPGMTPFVCPGASSALFMIGVPEVVGVYVYQIDALMSDDSHTFWDVTSHTIALAPGCPTITITPASPLPGAFVGEPLAIVLAADGGVAPYVWDVAEGSELPDGITLDVAGELEGAATTPGVYTFTIRATDDNGCQGLIAYSFTITAPDPIVVTPLTLPVGARGELYAALFTAEEGIGPPYVFTLENGALPPGITLDDDGTLAGLPSVGGAFTFTIRATDSATPAGNFGERAYTLELAGLRIVIGGVDVTIEVAAADLELGLNRQATGSLEIGDEYIPARGADVLIYARDGVTPIFGGLVLLRRIQGMTDANPANKGNVELVDHSIYFDDADPVSLVSAVTEDLEDVIASIVAQSLAVYGITYTPTATGLTVPPRDWTGITVPDAFKRIFDGTGVVVRVLPSKALVAFRPLDEPAPVTITDANINAFDLSWSDPPNLPRNTVDLLCGPTGNGVTTQEWTADGIETSWEVDIQAVIGDYFPGARAHAFLGVTGNFADGDTVTLGSSTYTMRASLVGDVAGEVLIGADGNASLANIVAAIVDSGAPVYAPSTAANTDADAYMQHPDRLAANALTIGVAGNSIGVSTTGAAGEWYGEGGIPLSTMQLGADPAGAAGWTQGYILENGTLAQTLGSPPGAGATYSWDVTAGRGTVAVDAGTTPAAGTVLRLVYLAVFPFHARVSSGSPPITFREDHPEVVSYADGIALATQILIRESATARELEVFTDVDGFLPGQELDVNTTHRGGLVAAFLVATVQITLVNADLWEYRIAAQESAEYAGSFVEQWKALTGAGGGSSSASPGTLTAAVATPILNVDIGAAAAIDWTKISKAGSSLADLITRNAADLASNISAVPFNAANFTGSPGMTWTLASGDQQTFDWAMLSADLMLVDLVFNTTTVGGTPGPVLSVVIPNGRTAAKTKAVPAILFDNTPVNFEFGLARVLAGGTTIDFLRQNSINWSASTDLTYVRASIWFGVNP